jgi:hypothetical protein
MDYREGSVIEYTAFGGLKRIVLVTEKSDDVKNGRPGFDGKEQGSDSDSDGVWGYDDQISRVIKY